MEPHVHTKTCTDRPLPPMTPPNWKQLGSLSTGDPTNTVELSAAITRNKPLISHHVGRNSEAAWGVQEARRGKLHVVWFHLWDILGMTGLEGRNADRYLPRAGGRERMLTWGWRKRPVILRAQGYLPLSTCQTHRAMHQRRRTFVHKKSVHKLASINPT